MINPSKLYKNTLLTCSKTFTYFLLFMVSSSSKPFSATTTSALLQKLAQIAPKSAILRKLAQTAPQAKPTRYLSAVLLSLATLGLSIFIYDWFPQHLTWRLPKLYRIMDGIMGFLTIDNPNLLEMIFNLAMSIFVGLPVCLIVIIIAFFLLLLVNAVLGILMLLNKYYLLSLGGSIFSAVLAYRKNMLLRASLTFAVIIAILLSLNLNSSVSNYFDFGGRFGINTKLETKSVAPANVLYALVIKDNVNIRAQPSTTSAIVARARKGSRFQVLSHNDGWCQIKITLKGKEISGWVHRSFIKEPG